MANYVLPSVSAKDFEGRIRVYNHTWKPVRLYRHREDFDYVAKAEAMANMSKFEFMIVPTHEFHPSHWILFKRMT